MPETRRKWARWAIAFLVGLATLTAAGFHWRAAQIGSDAAYYDRTSIAETVRTEQDTVERTIELAAYAREYQRYRASYATAARVAPSDPELAASLRREATRRAAEAGVFGSFSIGEDALRPSLQPRPFDIDAREAAIRAQQSGDLEAPADLDPDGWAAAADEIRDRIQGLVRWAFVLLAAVLLYTIAEVSTRMRAMYAFACAGFVVYVVGLVGGLTTVFFA